MDVLITTVIVTAAFGVVLWRIRDVLKRSLSLEQSACSGSCGTCPMADQMEASAGGDEGSFEC